MIRRRRPAADTSIPHRQVTEVDRLVALLTVSAQHTATPSVDLVADGQEIALATSGA